MAEIAGLVVGAASLAGLFSTCLDLLDNVGAALDAHEDYQSCLWHFRACKLLFEEWGNSTKFNEGEPQDPVKRKVVYHMLATMEQLFTNASVLEYRYGVCIPSRYVALKRSESSISILKRARWAIKDKKKFLNLIAMVATLVEKIRQLVPVADKGTAEIQEALLSLKDLVNGKPSFCS